MPEFVARLCVGRPGVERAAVWRVWAPSKKGDVYVAVRTIAGAIKVSLHESGACAISATSQYAEANPGIVSALKGSRHIDQWSRPVGVADAYITPFRILVPSDQLRPSLDSDDRFQWIAPGSVEQSVAISFSFGMWRAPDQWPGKHQGTHLLADVGLSHGEHLWVTEMKQLTHSSVHENIELARQRMIAGGVWRRGSRPHASEKGLRMTVGSIQDGSNLRILTDAAFDPAEQAP